MEIKKKLSFTNIKSGFLFLLIIQIVSCRPVRNFENTKHPKAPDYTLEKNWIALPWRADIGDTIPKGCTIKEDQKNAQVDVFFIYPTVYIKGSKWNADVENKRINKKADKCIQLQATAFNSCGRIFAPRYRQAVLKSFINEETKGKAALDLAYEDIKKAFEYYLEHWNNGRPIIIAGHSQGARHTMRLLKDFFDGKELQKKLVAAYPIGMPIKKDELKYIFVSENETQTGCYITWNTFAWNTRQNIRHGFFLNAACVNPLTMKTDEKYADASLNMGGVSYEKFNLYPGVCDAQVKGSLLLIHKPKQGGFFRISKTYHLFDYQLFYMNIRSNAKLRTEVYLKMAK
jgi:hypothetical protein